MSSKRRISIGIASDLLGNWESRAKKMKSCHAEESREEFGKGVGDKQPGLLLSTIKEEESVRRTNQIFTPPRGDQSPFQFEALREEGKEEEVAVERQLFSEAQEKTGPKSVQSCKKTPQSLQQAGYITEKQEQDVKVQLRVSPLFPNPTQEQKVSLHFKIHQGIGINQQINFVSPKSEKSISSYKEVIDSLSQETSRSRSQKFVTTPQQIIFSPQAQVSVDNVDKNISNNRSVKKEDARQVKNNEVMGTSERKTCENTCEQEQDGNMQVEFGQGDKELNKENEDCQLDGFVENFGSQHSEKQLENEKIYSCEKIVAQENQPEIQLLKQPILSAEKSSTRQHHPSPISAPIKSSPHKISNLPDINTNQRILDEKNVEEGQIITPKIYLQTNSEQKLNSKNRSQKQTPQNTQLTHKLNSANSKSKQILQKQLREGSSEEIKFGSSRKTPARHVDVENEDKNNENQIQNQSHQKQFLGVQNQQEKSSNDDVYFDTILEQQSDEEQDNNVNNNQSQEQNNINDDVLQTPDHKTIANSEKAETQPEDNNRIGSFLSQVKNSNQTENGGMQQVIQTDENNQLQKSVEHQNNQEIGQRQQLCQNANQNSTEKQNNAEMQQQFLQKDENNQNSAKKSQNTEPEQLPQVQTPPTSKTMDRFDQNISKSAQISIKNKRKNFTAGGTSLTPRMLQVRLSEPSSNPNIFSTPVEETFTRSRSKSCSSNIRKITVSKSPHHFSDFDCKFEQVKKLSLTPQNTGLQKGDKLTPVSVSDFNIKKVENKEKQSGKSERYNTRSGGQRRCSLRLSGGSQTRGVTHMDMEQDIQRVLQDIGQNIPSNRKAVRAERMSQAGAQTLAIESDVDVVMEPAADLLDDFEAEYRQMSMVDPMMFKEQIQLLQQERTELKQKAWEYYEWGDKLNQQLTSTLHIHNDLQAQNQLLNQKVQDMEKHLAEREEHFWSAQEKLQQQLQQSQERVYELQREYLHKSQEAQQVICAKDKVISDVQHQLADLQSERTEIEQQMEKMIQALTEKDQKLNKQMEQMIQAVTEKDEKLNKYRTMIFEFREENKKFDDRHQEDKQKIKQLSAEVDRCKVNMVTLQQTLKDNRIQPPILK